MHSTTFSDPALAIPAPPRRMQPRPARRRLRAIDEALAAAAAGLAMALLVSEAAVWLWG